MRTAPDAAGATTTFQIIHPFHPLFGRQFERIKTKWTWSETWVYFLNDAGLLASVPTDWTTLSTPDPFWVLSKGRARFRPENLIHLAELIDGIAPSSPPRKRKGEAHDM